MAYINPLWATDAILCQEILVNIGWDNGVLPYVTKIIPKSLLICCQLDQ